MAWAAVIAGGVSLAGTLIGAQSAKKQMRQAEQMNVQNPGYRPNPALEENANILRNRFSNYTLPGYSTAVDAIDRQGEMAYTAALQGATSSSDILDAATRIAYGNQLATNDLNLRQAQGQEQALMQYLSANQMAGQEEANANAWDREEYLSRQKQQAELYNAGMLNMNNAIQRGLNTVGQFAGYAINNGLFGNNALKADQNINTVLPGYTVVNDPLSTANLQTAGVTMNTNPYIPKTLR